MAEYDERDKVADDAKHRNGKTEADLGDVSQQLCSVVVSKLLSDVFIAV